MDEPGLQPLTPAQLQRVIDANPFSTWMQLRVHRIDEGGLELRMPSRPEMLGTEALQRLHGGIISSLVDVACGYAAMCLSGRGVSTVNLQTDFHRAAGLGELRIEGTVLHQGGRLWTAQARVTCSAGILLASGRSTLYMSRDVHPVLAPESLAEALPSVHHQR
ncbi:PaaI family thioesterase [Pseudomonas fluorescens]|jgi:uncharacterized protein (TIGR00369 family)|uniref:PaaI family thioesterase n=1 Tax=Pseudomonas fluorescens TaxID=294 RepID=UPI001913359F|nr:PaaI family thioesterase [Pseudomonas fluorescens]